MEGSPPHLFHCLNYFYCVTVWVLKKSLCVKAVVERINSLGTESSRFSTVDYIPESFCIIDLKRHSEDRGGCLSDRLDPESHLSHIFFSATSSAYFCGRGKGIYDPWFPFQRKGNHFKFGSKRNNSRKGIEEF